MGKTTSERIKQHEDIGIIGFAEWLQKVAPTYTVTATKLNYHYDCTITDGTHTYRVELKEMPTKDYYQYPCAIINKAKTEPYKDQPPADIFWIRYRDEMIVTITREQARKYPTIKSKQYKTEFDPSQGYTYQTQYQISHTDEGITYHLYKGTKRIK